MITDWYFFDSYAIMEILRGNPNYKKYENSQIILTKNNIFEIYSNVLRDSGEEEANKVFNKYYPYITDFDYVVLKNAAKLWVKYRGQNVSMTDCIGYILAKKLDIKFLTGDKEFEYFENVEFVK